MPRKSTSRPPRFESDLDYLESEVKWLKARIQRIAARRGLDEALGKTLPQHPGMEIPSADKARRRLVQAQRKESSLRREIDARLTSGRRARKPTALDRICKLYGLDTNARTVLLLACATGFSRQFEKYFGLLLEDNFGILTPEVAFAFLELSFADRIRYRAMFRKDAPLVANELLFVDAGTQRGPEDLLDTHLRIHARTFSYLVGDALPPDEMLEYSAFEEPRASLEQVVLDAKDKQRILSVVEHHDEYLRCRREWGFDEVVQYGRGIVLLFHGEPGTGKTMMAHAVADLLGTRILRVDIPTFLNHKTPDRFLPGLFREARLQDALLFFDECDTLFESRQTGNVLMN
ncbi:MAG: ATP-binding protein, partial [Proteobacteria bacterium]|nr:ATP-binding protein [Pseudomonadota bacterium]